MLQLLLVGTRKFAIYKKNNPQRDLFDYLSFLLLKSNKESSRRRIVSSTIDFNPEGSLRKQRSDRQYFVLISCHRPSHHQPPQRGSRVRAPPSYAYIYVIQEVVNYLFSQSRDGCDAKSTIPCSSLSRRFKVDCKTGGWVLCSETMGYFK